MTYVTSKRLAVATFTTLTALAAAMPQAALAHHPMGGKLPATFMEGLLSGIGHPVIGLDHFAFVVGLGIVAAAAGLGLALPLLFVAFMCAGLGVHILGLSIPGVELLIAMSVVLVGAAIVWNRTGGNRWIEGALFAAAGTVHGYAFAEAIIGAEATPLVAYIAALAIMQMAIAAGAYLLTRAIIADKLPLPQWAPRAAGAALLAAGVFFAAGAAGLVT